MGEKSLQLATLPFIMCVNVRLRLTSLRALRDSPYCGKKILTRLVLSILVRLTTYDLLLAVFPWPRAEREFCTSADWIVSSPYLSHPSLHCLTSQSLGEDRTQGGDKQEELRPAVDRDDGHVQECFATSLVEITLSQDFFLHSILALTAFHKAHTHRPSFRLEREISAAHIHHTSALHSFSQRSTPRIAMLFSAVQLCYLSHRWRDYVMI